MDAKLDGFIHNMKAYEGGEGDAKPNARQRKVRAVRKGLVREKERKPFSGLLSPIDSQDLL
jgi:hypothetical protein